eukprot:364840-Chlamydomonas_euryale.AAC.10
MESHAATTRPVACRVLDDRRFPPGCRGGALDAGRGVAACARRPSSIDSAGAVTNTRRSNPNRDVLLPKQMPRVPATCGGSISDPHAAVDNCHKEGEPFVQHEAATYKL